MQEDNDSTIGQRVRTLRQRRGWSQKKLASLVPGVSQQSIDHLERGRVGRPRFLPEIAEALGVPEPWLRTGRVESILPLSDLPPDDLDVMHEVVLAVEGMLNANGWRLDLASKKLIVRCAYELYLIRHQRVPVEPVDITKLAEAVMAEYTPEGHARTPTRAAREHTGDPPRVVAIETFKKSDET